ncbi:MAG: SusF/SusE family outer membrane protein [Muribaculaceae bacterium]|nr:SusF/SusE family outer membrane protein [Muribaculaceae bacterium]
MTALAASTDYTGTMKTNSSQGTTVDNNAVIKLDKSLLGLYTATIDNFTLNLMGEEVNFGTLEYSNMIGIPAGNGYKTIKGSKTIDLTQVLGEDGILSMIPEQYRSLISLAGLTYPVTMEAKFNDVEMTATFDCHVTVSVSFMGFDVPLIDETVNKEFAGVSKNQPEPALYLVGSFNEWNEEEMVPLTLGNDGKWTVTQAMDADAEFKLKDEKGEWLGAVSDGNFIVTKEQVTDATLLTLSSPGMNFQIPVAGTWTLTVDKENLNMVISGEWNEPIPEPVDIYILGEVNENSWAPNVGLLMTKAEDANIYTADITADGRNDGFNYFSFTTKLAEEATDWAAIAPYRIGAVSEGDFWVTDDMLNTDLSLQAGEAAFKIPTGKYALTLDYDAMTLVIKKDLIPGDVNGDGKVDVEDVNAVINIILNLKTTEDYPGNADLLEDGKVDVEDLNAVINLILAI